MNLKMPNSLPQSKEEYVQELMNLVHQLWPMPFTYMPNILNVILVMYHCEIPMEKAKEHVTFYTNKLKAYKEARENNNG